MKKLPKAPQPPTTLEEIYYAIGITGDEAIVSGMTEPKAEIAKTIQRLPEDVRAVLFGERDLHFFTGRVLGVATQVFIPASDKDRTIDVVFLASDVWRKPREIAMDIIAHELAHVFLKHNAPECHGGIPVEEEADDLAASWGFKRSYTKAGLAQTFGSKEAVPKKSG